jgi:mxaA protein
VIPVRRAATILVIPILAIAILAIPCAVVRGQTTSQERAPVGVSVRQPRAFGYVIGDRLEQRITLSAPAGMSLDVRSLPRPGRTGLWLELSPPRLTWDRHDDTTRYRLSLDYQVVNVPEQVTTIDLPAVDLVFIGRGGRQAALLDEWPITIAPITPTYVLGRAGLAETRPDAPPPLPDPARYMRLTLLWAAAILAVIAVTAVRRRGGLWLRRGARPFAKAARDLRKLARLPPERATYERGLQRLHRAFDAAAGRVMFGDRLSPLFAAHPELAGLRAAIEQFYAASQREFFGTGSGSASLHGVLALAERCREAEASARRESSAIREAGRPDRRPRAV